MIRSFRFGALLLALLLPSVAQAAPLTYLQWFSASDLALGESSSSTAQERHFASVDLRADYGSVGLSVDGAESSGVARFRDEWTITGGSGQVEIFWALDGSITLNAPSAVCTTCSVDSATVRLNSMFGTSSIFSSGTTVHTVTQPGAGSQNVNTAGSFLFSYTSDQPFGAGFSLVGGTGDDFYGGALSFFNSAEITAVVLSDGASLRTASNATYNVVNAVPEPATLLLTAPVVLLLFRRRRL